MTLIDTDVLLDLVTDDPNWADWSIAQLEAASLRSRHGSYATSSTVPGGKSVHAVSQVGGSRTGVLPDFFIGAHAAVNELPLVTRDVGRYRTYFPSLKLITRDG